MDINWKQAENLIKIALAEDLNDVGDITSKAIVDEKSETSGIFLAKDSGIVAGVPVVERCFKLFDKSVDFEAMIGDGEMAAAGETIIRVMGKTRSLLAVERTALNFLGRLSGIATVAAEAVKKVKDYPVLIMDTRKTTPGFRNLEKYAAEAGGATNHRTGLYDGVLVKENHITETGGIAPAVEKLKKAYPGVNVEVEVESMDELRQAVNAGADIVMLDNIDPHLIKKAVQMTVGEVKLEASGGITLDNVAEVAAAGVHRISMGQITDASRMDISFLLE